MLFRSHQEWIDDVLQRRPLGVLLVLSELTAIQRRQLETRSIPIVAIDTLGEPPAGLPTVGSQNWNGGLAATRQDRKSTRLNSSHVAISYAVFCLKKKKKD